MANRDILAIGTSAGGVEALLTLARHFPSDFPAAIFVTIHLASQFRSSLDEILSRAGPLPAIFARDGDSIERGRIFVAPVDRHLLVEGNKILLGHGSRENNARPAIDPMMRSVAACCGARAVGVVLTGTLGDGASGLWAVGQCGGITVVQDPKDAAFPEMPANALKQLKPDHVVTLGAMPKLLLTLALQKPGTPMPVPERIRFELEVAKGGHSTIDDMDRIGRRSGFGCPDCHGAMWQLEEGELVRFRCHVGHTYTAEMMNVALDENLRRSLASALRVLEERLALSRDLESRAEQNGQPRMAASWAERADGFLRELNVIRESVQRVDKIAAVWQTKDAAE